MSYWNKIHHDQIEFILGIQDDFIRGDPLI